MAVATAKRSTMPSKRPVTASTRPPVRTRSPRLVSTPGLAAARLRGLARGDGHRAEYVVDHVCGRRSRELRLGREHEAVLENGTGEGLQVVRYDEVAAERQRQSARR